MKKQMGREFESQGKELEYCIENAHLFGADIVGTFAGALPGLSVDKTIPEFKKVFSELTKAAKNFNVKIGIGMGTIPSDSTACCTYLSEEMQGVNKVYVISFCGGCPQYFTYAL